MAISIVVIAFVLYISSTSIKGDEVIEVKFPQTNIQADDYYCTRVQLPQEEGYIVGFTPAINASNVHHMLLYGCHSHASSSTELNDPWSCMGLGSICSKLDQPETMFAWALQAEGLQLPTGVGFKVGGAKEKAVRYLVMQVHFRDIPSDRDKYPKLSLIFTTSKQPYVAGIYLIGGAVSGGLQPGVANITVDSACYFEGPKSITPFAFRTHAHTHGTAIYGYVVSSGEWQLIGQRSPQDPQAFYPVVTDDLVIHQGDILAARTYYNTQHETNNIDFGSKGENEMSNFYIMYYSDNDDISLLKDECWMEAPPTLPYPPSDPVLPVHDASHHHGNHHHDDNIEVQTSNQTNESTTSVTTPTTTMGTTPTSTIQVDDTWPYNNGFNEPVGGITVGGITSVDIDSEGNVYMLHRSHVQWNEWSFDINNVYLRKEDGPIPEAVILKLRPSGEFITSWGGGVFYMPHGLTVSSTGQYWVTDVARHQLLKTFNDGQKILALGVPFVPGEDTGHFCKPSDVALDEIKGVFYIADGYCNHRVSIFTLKGEFLDSFPSIVDGVELFVPHSLALTRNGEELYVADRQNGRIVVYDTNTKTGRVFIGQESLTGLVFAIAFGNRDNEWPLYAVNGSQGGGNVYGHTINDRAEVTDIWGPKQGFHIAHDIAVTGDGQYIYIADISTPTILWRLRDTSLNTTDSIITDSIISDTLPLSNVGQDSTVIPLPVITTSTITISTTTTSLVMLLPSKTPAKDEGEESYECPRPPPPLPTSVSCTTAKHTPTNLPVNDEVDEVGMSLYVVLIMMGAVFWVALVILICAVLCCAKKVSRKYKMKQSIVKRHYSVDPKKKLQSLLNKNSRKGFTPINAQSDSESDNELTVFQRT